jgi:hypothetical protein
MTARNPSRGTAVAFLAASDECDLVESLAIEMHERLARPVGG